jgi:hypothetical protein
MKFRLVRNEIIAGINNINIPNGIYIHEVTIFVASGKVNPKSA